MLLLAPMVHSLGFFFALKGLALGETTVVMNRAGFGDMLGAAERYKATLMTLAPPVVVAMSRSEEAGKYELGELKRVVCGGAPLSAEVAQRFMARFPHVQLQVVIFFPPIDKFNTSQSARFCLYIYIHTYLASVLQNMSNFADRVLAQLVRNII